MFRFRIIWLSLFLCVTPANAECTRAKSVYQVNLAIDGSIVALSTLAIFVPYLNADRWIRYRCPCDPGEVNGLDRNAIGNSNPTLDTLSDVTAILSVVVPPAADLLDVGWTREFVEDFTVYAEVLSINGALVSIAKYTVQRPLPRTYAGDQSLIQSPAGYRSFYSGHTSTTFSALTAASLTMNLRHHSGVWPWLVTAGVGTSVALERVAAGRHFYSDVAVGAVAGALVGTVVPWLHKREDAGALSSISIRPTDIGVSIAWNRAF